MWYYYFNVGLTYLTIGFASAVFFYFILKKPALGKFWGALLVGLIGSFLGGVIEYLLDDVFRYLSDFNSLNLSDIKYLNSMVFLRSLHSFRNIIISTMSGLSVQRVLHLYLTKYLLLQRVPSI